MEQISYNLLFRWFVGLGIDEPLWVAITFTKNRERLLRIDMPRHFFQAVVSQAQAAGLMSDEHFTVDGTFLEAWASQKNFKPKEGSVVTTRTRAVVVAMSQWTSRARSAATTPMLK